MSLWQYGETLVVVTFKLGKKDSELPYNIKIFRKGLSCKTTRNQAWTLQMFVNFLPNYES